MLKSSFAVSKFEVTFDEWDACIAHGACTYWPGDNGGRVRQPVINVSWADAQIYVNWLSKLTGRSYRLLTEAEWEYAARAGTTTRYSFGDDNSKVDQHAWINRNANGRAHPVGGKTPNAFGLHDMHGNVIEWVQDCYQDTYEAAPTDGSVVTAGDCSVRMARGSAWSFGHNASNLRLAGRDRALIDFRVGQLAFALPGHYPMTEHDNLPSLGRGLSRGVDFRPISGSLLPRLSKGGSTLTQRD